jgi:hypothetical protein
MHDDADVTRFERSLRQVLQQDYRIMFADHVLPLRSDAR